MYSFLFCLFVCAHSFEASLLDRAARQSSLLQILIPLHILSNLQVDVVVLLEDHVFEVSASGLHLAFHFMVGKLLHLAGPLLFKLQPLDPILHALQLGSLLNHLIVIVEHAEAFFVYAALATHRSRYLR